MFEKFLIRSTMLKNVPEISRMFQNFQGNSRTFEKYRKCLRTLWANNIYPHSVYPLQRTEIFSKFGWKKWFTMTFSKMFKKFREFFVLAQRTERTEDDMKAHCFGFDFASKVIRFRFANRMKKVVMFSITFRFF